MQAGHNDGDVALREEGRTQARNCRVGLTDKLQLNLEDVSVYTSSKLRARQLSEILGFSDQHIEWTLA